MDAAERDDAGNAASRADYHAAADLLPQDAVRRADVTRAFRGDRRRLQAETVLLDGRGCLVDDCVPCLPPGPEREIETR
jgi:hypothetical protein